MYSLCLSLKHKCVEYVLQFQPWHMYPIKLICDRLPDIESMRHKPDFISFELMKQCESLIAHPSRALEKVYSLGTDKVGYFTRILQEIEVIGNSTLF